MNFLIAEIVLCLLVAALIGWLMGRVGSRLKYNAIVDELEALRAQNRELEEYRERAEAEFKDLRADKARRLQVVTRQKTEISRLEEILRDVESERNQLAGKLRAIEAGLEQEQAALEADKQKYLDEKRALEAARRKTADELAERESQLQVLENRIAELEHQLKVQQEKGEMLRQRGEKLAEENERLRHDNLEAQERREAMLDEQKALLARFTSLEKLHEKEVVAKRQLLDEHIRLQERVAMLEKENEENRHQLDVLNHDLEDLTTQIIDIRNERDGLSGTLRSIASIARKIEGE